MSIVHIKDEFKKSYQSSVNSVASVMNKKRKNCIELISGKFHFYIDESGTPSSRNSVMDTDNEYFILSGLFISPARINIVEKRCRTILKKHLVISDEMYPELKYSSIMGKKNEYEKLKKPEELIMDILNVIRDERLPLFIIIANKQEHRNLRYKYSEIEHYYTSPYLIHQMVRYANNCDCKVDTIQDNFDQTQEEIIKKQIEDNRKKGYRMWGGQRYYESLETYSMKDSKEWIGLQLADICCGTVRRVLKRDKTDFYEVIKPLLYVFTNTVGKPHFHPRTKNYDNKEEALRVNILFGL